jgi:hypothetical protein
VLCGCPPSRCCACGAALAQPGCTARTVAAVKRCRCRRCPPESEESARSAAGCRSRAHTGLSPHPMLLSHHGAGPLPATSLPTPGIHLTKPWPSLTNCRAEPKCAQDGIFQAGSPPRTRASPFLPFVYLAGWFLVRFSVTAVRSVPSSSPRLTPLVAA